MTLFFPRGCSRFAGSGLEAGGQGLPFQSLPAESQAINLCPPPTARRGERGILAQGVRGNKRQKYKRLCKENNVFLTPSSHTMDT